ncbi:hypothetical protein [Paenibacillus mucilaginosus]|uniref:Uncharacterized protein n=1 Tax=Paenibacillus mucilaginosus (strain KNP414) TaxID=1036673 RepID=F8F8V1_PAEMK|nr:hypothetical protein [Paenibacillus mucilaginosus]AEI42013.1 hypothetical protein KNP414_03455 [Paenibacillus mucilaginosus KNP414]
MPIRSGRTGLAAAKDKQAKTAELEQRLGIRILSKRIKAIS